jgi:uncharacterized protein YdeI (YjbR/CyaY-like superfamily)
MKPLYFKTQAELRKWFEKNYLSEKEVFIAYYKKSSGKQSIVWAQAVEEALCFGWIDGVAAKIDEESYCNRFTPRRPKSNWSNVNIKRIQELMEAGLVLEAGKKTFETRDLRRQQSASFEQEKVEFTPAYLKKFKANKNAWKFYEAQTNTYKKQSAWYVISAKQEETRLRRLDLLIYDSENGIHIKPLRRADAKPQ